MFDLRKLVGRVDKRACSMFKIPRTKERGIPPTTASSKDEIKENG